MDADLDTLATALSPRTGGRLASPSVALLDDPTRRPLAACPPAPIARSIA